MSLILGGARSRSEGIKRLKRTLYPIPLLAVIATLGCMPVRQTGKSVPQTLKLAVFEEPRSVDPLIGIDLNSTHILLMTGEGLMRMGPDGVPVKGIAQDYTVSPDGTIYTFYLRNSCWSNGEALTAYDFERSWKRAADPSVAYGLYYLDCIKNMTRAFRKEVALDEIGVHAKSAYILSVQLEHPVPNFIEMTTLTAYFPIASSAISTASVTNGPIGNGPFRYEKRPSSKGFVLEKNPFYWDAEAVSLNRIEVSIISDSYTQAQLFEKRELDWYGNPLCWPSNESIKMLKQEYPIQEDWSHNVRWVMLNTQSTPFDNKKIRQAFARAVNRKQIVNALLAHQATPQTSILPVAMTSRTGPYFEDGDLATAQILFEEGLSEMALDRDHFPPITLYGAGDADFRFQLCQALQQQWQEAFSIRVTLQKESWNVLSHRLAKGHYQVLHLSWISYISDPIWFLKPFKDRSTGLNSCQWESPEYRNLIEESLKPTSQEERNIVLHKAESLLVDEMPLIPLFSMKDVYFKNPRLQGVYLSPFGRIDFKWAYFEEG